MAEGELAVEDVAVPGGSLRVGVRDGSGPLVVALHGITGTNRSWPFLAEAMPSCRLVAPDLRGRGGSRDLPGPWGMRPHADDVACVLRAESRPAIVVGHSMGAFVAVVLAHRHPDLVDRVVLVDGGLPFAEAELETTRSAVAAIRRRLETTFEDRAAYRAFYRDHPAFAADWTPEVAAYADYDLVGEPGRMHPSASLDAVLADQADLDDRAALRAALDAAPRPLTFLHAPRGFLDDPPGLYAAETVVALRREWPAIEVRFVPEVNHYTIVLSARGAAAVAEAVRTEPRR